MLASLLLATCSWSLTKRVRSLYKTEIQPMMTDLGLTQYDLEPFCPFKYIETRDVLAPYDKLKTKQSGVSYDCETCHKTFRTEGFAEQHIVKAHAVEAGSQDVCLADYCSFLPCDSSYLPHRCITVMDSCFVGAAKEAMISKLCLQEKTPDLWTISLGGYLALGVICGMLSFVYYMLVWSEEEQKPPDKSLKLSLKEKLS